jgi:hypothetical protein
MKKTDKTVLRGARKKARTRKRLITWTVAVAAIGVIGYGISNLSNIAYDEDDITAVRFDVLNAKQKHTALVAANSARCNCGCGMTLAQCVATDSSCPIREDNVEKIKTMVRDAMTSPES